MGHRALSTATLASPADPSQVALINLYCKFSEESRDALVLMIYKEKRNLLVVSAITSTAGESSTMVAIATLKSQLSSSIPRKVPPSQPSPSPSGGPGDSDWHTYGRTK